MTQLNSQVDEFLRRATTWRDEYAALRRIVLERGLTEELKWMHPCYTFERKNIVLIHGFKNYCTLLFFKGALLQDPQRVLVQQTDNVQAGRQIRFARIGEILALEPVLQAYIDEAIAVERAGLDVEWQKSVLIPQELQRQFDQHPALAAAFNSLTPGRQRAYILYFSAPKQSRTRAARVEKWVPQILAGKGLKDAAGVIPGP